MSQTNGAHGIDGVGEDNLLAHLPELQRRTNLFDGREAVFYSNYAGPLKPDLKDKDKFKHRSLHIIPAGRLHADKEDPPISPQGLAVHDMLRAHIVSDVYPCVGARAAFSQDSYRFGFYKDMAHVTSVAASGRDLARFVQEYEEIGKFTTFVMAFKYPQATTEEEFEFLLWRHLQMLHNYDEGSTWDPHYSPDPNEGNFAFSFRGKAFFVVGMHAGASRFSRRFGYPVLVFNPESQILRLKEAGMLEAFAEQVRHRDELYQGSINPSLPTDANSTGGEARVYSGMKHTGDDGWKCPFHARASVRKKD